MDDNILTWDEICQRYPGQHLGITQVETEDDGVNIRRAFVIYSNENSSNSEILHAVADSNGSIRSIYVPRNDMVDLTAAGYASV